MQLVNVVTKIFAEHTARVVSCAIAIIVTIAIVITISIGLINGFWDDSGHNDTGWTSLVGDENEEGAK